MSIDRFPDGWTQVTLQSIASWGSGGTPSRSQNEYYNGEIPWIKTGDLGPKIITQASEFITEAGVKNSSAKFFTKGSVVLAMYGATIGKTSILGIDATTNQACAVGTPTAGITSSEFLYYLLLNEKKAFIKKGKGGAQPNISQAVIKEHTVCLPPIAEQKIIADKLDDLLARVESIKTRLENIPEILKKFRQSVLSAAVSGKLTDEWRIENNKSFSDWISCNVGDVSTVSTGKTPKRSEPRFWENGSIPWLTSSSTGEINTHIAEQFVTATALEECNLKLYSPGTLLLAMYGEGKTRGQVTEIKISAACNQACAAINCDETKIVTHFLKLRLLENYQEIRKAAVGGNQPNLNLNKVRDIFVLVPSLAEQKEIINRVNHFFDYAEFTEKMLGKALSRIYDLTQSILAKAFRGELTAQWREENPELISGLNSAEALLEKITAEKLAAGTIKKFAKKTSH